VLATVVAAGPFLWALVTAFEESRDLYQPANTPSCSPPAHDLARRLPVRAQLVPDLRVEHAVGGGLVVAITLAPGLPAAYSLARLDRPWARPMGVAIFRVYFVPPTLLFLSLSAGRGGGRAPGLDVVPVLVHPMITIPVSVWLLIGCLKLIPRDIEEQVMIDGTAGWACSSGSPSRPQRSSSPSRSPSCQPVPRPADRRLHYWGSHGLTPGCTAASGGYFATARTILHSPLARPQRVEDISRPRAQSSTCPPLAGSEWRKCALTRNRGKDPCRRPRTDPSGRCGGSGSPHSSAASVCQVTAALGVGCPQPHHGIRPR
jgi:hypothetical protein